MEAIAQTKYLRISPQKVRLVMRIIEGMNVEEAIHVLNYTTRAAAIPLAKTIQSAFANLGSKEEGDRLDMKDVYITEAHVDGGPTLKRFRPMSMGRAGKIRKRTSHITIKVEHFK